MREITPKFRDPKLNIEDAITMSINFMFDNLRDYHPKTFKTIIKALTDTIIKKDSYWLYDSLSRDIVQSEFSLEYLGTEWASHNDVLYISDDLYIKEIHVDIKKWMDKHDMEHLSEIDPDFLEMNKLPEKLKPYVCYMPDLDIVEMFMDWLKEESQ